MLFIIRLCKELFCSLITGLFAMPLGILQFIPVYHVLHDNYGLHTEICVFLLVLVYGLIIWNGDRQPNKLARTLPNKGQNTFCITSQNHHPHSSCPSIHSSIHLFISPSTNPSMPPFLVPSALLFSSHYCVSFLASVHPSNHPSLSASASSSSSIIIIHSSIISHHSDSGKFVCPCKQ